MLFQDDWCVIEYNTTKVIDLLETVLRISKLVHIDYEVARWY